MDRYEIARLRRSWAMLSPDQHALTREQAIALAHELARALDQLRALRHDLLKLTTEIEARGVSHHEARNGPSD